MTTTSAVSSTTTTASTTTSSATSTANSSASTAYSTFLTLLTTQLTHQDPTNPTDTNQFTSELISLASVEQLEAVNSQLTSMVTKINNLTASNGIGYLGTTVSWSGDTAPLQSGSAAWSYTLPSDAASVSLTVTDSSGNTVATATGDTTSGSHSFTWNGTGSDGTSYSSGDYTLTVTAKDSSGKALTTTTTAKGKVTAVDSSSGTSTLDVGGVSVGLSDVTSVASS